MPASPVFANRDNAVDVNNFLQNIGFHEQPVLDYLKIETFADLRQVPERPEAFSCSTDLTEAFIDAFVVGKKLHCSRLEKLPSRIKTILQTSKLWAHNEDVLTPLVRIFPVRDCWFACDPRVDRSSSSQVMWPTKESLLLHEHSCRYSPKSYLDIGTGCGLHAVLQAKKKIHSHGIDNNGRAVEFSRFNAMLNQVDSATFSIADIRNSLANAEKFDLITCQPPYAPDSIFNAHSNYWSGGPTGDSVLAAVLAAVPQLLSQSGLCIIYSMLSMVETDCPDTHLKNITPSSLKTSCRGKIVDYANLSRLLNGDKFGELEDGWRERGITKFWKGFIHVQLAIK